MYKINTVVACKPKAEATVSVLDWCGVMDHPALLDH